jgi:hypothetical protein
MTVDIRAEVTCSLGVVISGSISDDYLQGSGLVKTQGSVLISGLITPDTGTVVTFQYTKSGITRSIPRNMRVLSSFADPYRRTTQVELGCTLTYLSDLKDRIDWTAFDDPENASRTKEEARIVTIPIQAASIASKCLQELGVTASANPLTSQFSIASFSFDGGYVSTLSDLLVSESYCGYLDAEGVLQVFSLNQEAGTGPVFTADDIVDLGPIGVGQLPGEAVTTSYSTLKLKPPEPPQEEEEEEEGEEGNTAMLNWEFEETQGAESRVFIDWQLGDDPTPRRSEYVYFPRSSVYTEYDDWDRMTSRLTVETTIGAAVNTTYYRDVAAAGNAFFGDVWARSQVQIITRESPTYAVGPVNSESKPENYDEVRGSVSIKTGPNMALLGAAGISTAFNGSVGFESGTSVFEEIVSSYITGTKPVTVDGKTGTVPVTRRSTSKSMAYAFTQQGQQDFAQRAELGSAINFSDAFALTGAGTETITNTGREVALQSRPSQTDRTNAEYNKDGDPANGWQTESKAELELAIGSAAAQRRTEFSLPYAPDDIFSADGEGSFTTTASDAPAKANNYGRLQNRLLLGNRNGISLQVAPERLPAAPFSPLYIEANGLTGMYRTNGTSWAFDGNGIIASVDALFWAAVGGTGDFWFPVAPGIVTLPSSPSVIDTSPTEVIGTIETVGSTPQTTLDAAFPDAVSGDGVQDETTEDFWVYNGSTWANVGPAPGPTITPTTVIPPYNETYVYNGILRTRLSITKINYALQLLTEVPALLIKTRLSAVRILKIDPTALAVTVAAQVPNISIVSPAVIEVPVVTVAVAGLAPSAGAAFDFLDPANIGLAVEGGFFVGLISHTANSIATHALIVAPRATGATGTGYTPTTDLRWKNSNTTTTDSVSPFDGAVNTAAMVTAGIFAHPAASFCVGLSVGGYSDWYLPSRYELDIAYENLKPTTTDNTFGWGINPYSVPERTVDRTTGVPAQTSITAFQSGGVEAFAAGSHWSSTQDNSFLAWNVFFSTGGQNSSDKMNINRVRAFRKIAL